MTDANTGKPVCLYCEKDSTEVPLIGIEFKGENRWICPQHLPILIHKPAMLAGKLPGADQLAEAPGH